VGHDTDEKRKRRRPSTSSGGAFPRIRKIQYIDLKTLIFFEQFKESPEGRNWYVS